MRSAQKFDVRGSGCILTRAVADDSRACPPEERSHGAEKEQVPDGHEQEPQCSCGSLGRDEHRVVHEDIASQSAGGEPKCAAHRPPPASQDRTHCIWREREREEANGEHAPTTLGFECVRVRMKQASSCDGEDERQAHFEQYLATYRKTGGLLSNDANDADNCDHQRYRQYPPECAQGR